MAYTENRTYYDEKTHYEIRPNVIVPRKKPKQTTRLINEDFILNFRINEEVLKKFSDYCKEHGLKKSKVVKKYIVDIVDNGLGLKKFEKYEDAFLVNKKNISVKIKKELYDNFVKVCHEKGYKDVSGVLRSFIVHSYSEEVEEDSETGE